MSAAAVLSITMQELGWEKPCERKCERENERERKDTIDGYMYNEGNTSLC